MFIAQFEWYPQYYMYGDVCSRFTVVQVWMICRTFRSIKKFNYILVIPLLTMNKRINQSRLVNIFFCFITHGIISIALIASKGEAHWWLVVYLFLLSLLNWVYYFGSLLKCVYCGNWELMFCVNIMKRVNSPTML